MNTGTPWINSISHTQAAHSEPIYSATWAAWVHLRDFSELLGFQWGFNARDLRQDALERNLQFVKALCTFRPSEDGWRRTLILRMYKREDKLKFLLISRSIADTPESARNGAFTSWLHVQSTYPYDYDLVPLLSEREYAENVSQRQHECIARHITVFYPCARYSTPTDAMAISTGFWSSSETSPELIWRVLSNTPEPVTLEIYLQPTILHPGETSAFDTLKNTLHSQLEKAPIRSGLKDWLDTFSSRFPALQQPYLVQFRVFSSQPIPDYILRVIGSSLTYPLSINSYEILQPIPKQLPGWQKCIEKHEFIDCGTPLPIPPRLPYLATLQEAAKVFRVPFLPKGGIPNLKIDIARKDS